jgi:AIPR protein
MAKSHRASVSFRILTDEFRSLPFPRTTNSNGNRTKLATCFVRVEDLPDGFESWMKVNPRVPKFDTKKQLRGPVAKAMVQTLLDEPDKFALKNQGIYILAKEVSYQKEEGGCGMVTLVFDNPSAHGLVNGGHSYMAIRQARAEREASEAAVQPWDAFVRLHIMQGVDEEDITELAEGLNRSMQVDDPSLENLKGSFDKIKEHLSEQPGHEQIAYRQGDPGEVDIRQVLSYMALFDLEQFPDRKTHPNKLFGQQKGVLQRFIEDTDPENKDSKHIFDKILPKLHEILVLADKISQKAVISLAKLKVKESKGKGGDRVRSAGHRNRPAHFAGGTIDGLMMLGWLYPMLASFRANISREAWAEGKLAWHLDPEDLLEKVWEEMADVVKQEHVSAAF